MNAECIFTHRRFVNTLITCCRGRRRSGGGRFAKLRVFSVSLARRRDGWQRHCWCRGCFTHYQSPSPQPPRNLNLAALFILREETGRTHHLEVSVFQPHWIFHSIRLVLGHYLRLCSSRYHQLSTSDLMYGGHHPSMTNHKSACLSGSTRA